MDPMDRTLPQKIPLDERNDYILALDEELHRGGVSLSEWSTFLAQDAEMAFCAGADLATLLAAQSAMETHLRHEFASEADKRVGFAQLIDKSDLPEPLRKTLHDLRRYRNRWVHVSHPEEDGDLLEHPERHRAELEEMAIVAIRAMLEVLYLVQWT
jgi:hypothetical protein